MCTSVPQIPVRWTRIRTSLMPMMGSGMSLSQRPGSACALTSAFTGSPDRYRIQTRLLTGLVFDLSGLHKPLPRLPFVPHGGTGYCFPGGRAGEDRPQTPPDCGTDRDRWGRTREVA